MDDSEVNIFDGNFVRSVLETLLEFSPYMTSPTSCPLSKLNCALLFV